MSGSSQDIFSQLTKLPSATADSNAQVGLGIPPSFTKPSLSGHFLYTGRWWQPHWTMTTSDNEHNCRDDQETISNIEKYGLTVIMIEGTDYLPSFAYSIGLWKKFGHPELISFGLTGKTLHEIINLAADIVKSGQKLETGRVYTDFFETGKSEFISVDKRNIRDYFGYAIDFYNTVDFPALQLVWTDRNDKFP